MKTKTHLQRIKSSTCARGNARGHAIVHLCNNVHRFDLRNLIHAKVLAKLERRYGSCQSPFHSITDNQLEYVLSTLRK